MDFFIVIILLKNTSHFILLHAERDLLIGELVSYNVRYCLTRKTDPDRRKYVGTLKLIRLRSLLSSILLHSKS